MSSVRPNIKPSIKLQAVARHDRGERLSGTIQLRGGSVAILMILHTAEDYDDRWVIVTEQTRMAAGSLSFVEIPAGMLDNSNNFAGAAARGIEAEIGYRVEVKDLIDMTKFAAQRHKRLGEDLHDAMYPNPGACDEFVAIFLWQKTVSHAGLEELNRRMTEQRADQGNFGLRLIPYGQLHNLGCQHARTFAVYSLYKYLKNTGDYSDLD